MCVEDQVVSTGAQCLKHCLRPPVAVLQPGQREVVTNDRLDELLFYTKRIFMGPHLGGWPSCQSLKFPGSIATTYMGNQAFPGLPGLFHAQWCQKLFQSQA
jgi:hypothetical protein